MKTKTPPTFCDTCRLAEMTPLQRLRELIWPERKMILPDMRGLIVIALGSRPPTAYERHRDLFTKTGDAIEFERMMRHVK